MRLLSTIAIIITVVFAANSTKAAGLIYTAVASGNFNSASTWQGGNIPPTTMAADSVYIPSGITVSITADIIISGSTADVFDVQGVLSAPTNTIQFVSVLLSGVGDIIADSFSGNFRQKNFLFSGNMNIAKLNGNGIYSGSGATFNISNTLYLTDTMNLASGRLNMMNGSRFHITQSVGKPSLLKLGGGATTVLTAPYDVEYHGTNLLAAIELTGAGLRNVTIGMNDSATNVTLAQALVVDGKLHIATGMLNLNAKNLVLNGDIQCDPKGAIKSGAFSNINFFTPGTVTGPLSFVPKFDTVNTFTLNTNATVPLGSSMTIERTLNLTKGKLYLNKQNIIMMVASAAANASPASYVITGDTGHVVTNIVQAGSYFFPVGTFAEYTPCKITSNLNDSVTRNMRVRVSPGVKASGYVGNDMAASQPVVNATWFLAADNKAVDYKLAVSWGNSAEVKNFDRSKSFMVHYINAYWTTLNGSAATSAGGLHTLERDAIKQTGPFAIFDANTVTVKDVVAQKEIKLFPNPATTVLYADVQERVQAQVYSTTGQLVSSTMLDARNNAINVSALAPGMYYIILHGDELKATGRFVKQ